MLQKWEKELQVKKTILHPTPSMTVDGSSTCVGIEYPSGPCPTYFRSAWNRCRYTIW